MTLLYIDKKERNAHFLNKLCLKKAELSWGAKGLHLYLMTLPSGWRVEIQDLKQHSSDSYESIYHFLNELIQEGYASKKIILNEKNKSSKNFEYIIHERPLESPFNDNKLNKSIHDDTAGNIQEPMWRMQYCALKTEIKHFTEMLETASGASRETISQVLKDAQFKKTQLEKLYINEAPPH